MYGIPSDVPAMIVPCLPQDGTEKAQKVFTSLPTEVGQTEAEEIGETRV